MYVKYKAVNFSNQRRILQDPGFMMCVYFARLTKMLVEFLELYML